VNRKKDSDATVDISEIKKWRACELIHHPGCRAIMGSRAGPGDHTGEPKLSENRVFQGGPR